MLQARKLSFVCVAILFASIFSGCALDFHYRPITPEEVFRDTPSDWVVEKHPELGSFGPRFEIVARKSK